MKRQISLKAINAGEIKPTGGNAYKSEIKVIQGIESEKAREINKAIKDAKLKGVQVQIQGEQLRVSGKSRDALQEVIQLVKEKDFDIPLQFTNYR